MMERCQAQFAWDPTAGGSPSWSGEFSTHRVIAMQFTGRVGGADLEVAEAVERRSGREVAIRGARILLTQIFRFGFLSCRIPTRGISACSKVA